MLIETVTGNLLDQNVEAIVNAWNRNIIPWWLLRPHGVSGAIKRRAGVKPFQELAKYGRLTLGQAVLTGPGRLPYRGIIHVAAITLWGRSNQRIIRDCTHNAITLAQEKKFSSLAFPILGSGSGGIPEETALSVMIDELQAIDYEGRAVVVQYRSAEHK